MINIFFLAFLICLLLTNITINVFYQLNVKQYVLRDAPKSHLIKEGTPTMGGVPILITVMVMIIFNRSLINYTTISLLLLIVLYALIGLIDDLQKVFQQRNKGLSAGMKFLLQIVAASAFTGLLMAQNHAGSATGIMSFMGPAAYYLFVIILITGFSNAVNLTDGLDGLAPGTLLITFTGLFIFAFMSMNYALVWICLMVMGALFGFLWFNLHPAKIFMGDTGALALGALFAGTGVLLHLELLLLLIGIVFVLETASVIIQVSYFKISKGKRIFKMSPLHHHFELCGWTENKVVTRFWMISILALILSLKVG